jgi:stress-induced morphogen
VLRFDELVHQPTSNSHRFCNISSSAFQGHSPIAEMKYDSAGKYQVTIQ